MVGRTSRETGSKCNDRVDSRCGTKRICCVSEEEDEDVAVAGALLLAGCAAVEVVADVAVAALAACEDVLVWREEEVGLEVAVEVRAASPDVLRELLLELDVPPPPPDVAVFGAPLWLVVFVGARTG